MALVIERILDSRFEFSLDGGDPISDNAPNLTTFGNECHFKTKNGANIIKNQKITHEDVTIIDTYGGTGTFTNFSNVQNLWLKLIDVNFFAGANGSGSSSGVTRFDALLDGFQYFGNDGKVPVVDEDQLKLIATQFYNYNKLTQLDDVAITDLVAGKFVSVQSIGGQLKFVLTDVNGVSSSSDNTLKKIIYIAEEGDTSFSIDNSPNQIFLYKNGNWQIESSDFTYLPGEITLLQDTYEDDYFEVIPLSSSIKKIVVTATTDNQTEFNYDGNPAFVDAYLKGTRLREGTDYTRTTFSTGNKVIIINQYLIDDIAIGDKIELITY